MESDHVKCHIISVSPSICRDMIYLQVTFLLDVITRIKMISIVIAYPSTTN